MTTTTHTASTAGNGDRLPALTDHALIGKAAEIPSGVATTVVSFAPVVLPTPDRVVDLQMRISVPAEGDRLPVILLSHGHGASNNLSSMHGYGPLVHFWASRGFAVIQPTHLSSKSLSLPPTTPGAPIFWRSRVQDMTRIIDGLGAIEQSVPALQGRLDHQRIAVVGHSLGGHTASVLLGMELTDPDDGTTVRMADPRITAGVLLAPPGSGGADLAAGIAERVPVFTHPQFARMTTPTLVVVGDEDVSPHLTVRGADWHADPYTLSPGPKHLLTLFGGQHLLGGVSGYDAAETTDENPERVATVQRMTWAYLRSAFDPEHGAWTAACAALATTETLGRIEST